MLQIFNLIEYRALLHLLGVYLITNTIYVPPGTFMKGEGFSVLMAANVEGSASGTFSNPEEPVAMLQVYVSPGHVVDWTCVRFVITVFVSCAYVHY